MDTLSYKTISAKKSTVDKQWAVLDAEGQSLGRVASVAAQRLRGKHKPNFTPHVDCGDYIIVTNAAKVELTGKKWTDKRYMRYTGYPGGERYLTAHQLYKKDPRRLVEKAVKGMLPKTKLGDAIYRNLYVYKDADHKHEAQKPETINLNDLV